MDQALLIILSNRMGVVAKVSTPAPGFEGVAYGREDAIYIAVDVAGDHTLEASDCSSRTGMPPPKKEEARARSSRLRGNQLDGAQIMLDTAGMAARA
jgi:hypothetical protein